MSVSGTVRWRVIICYSQDGIKIAKTIRDKLVTAGFDVYLAEMDLLGGEFMLERIVKEIRERDAVVVVNTSQTHRSRWVRAEICYAFMYGKPIIPFVQRNSRVIPTLDAIRQIRSDKHNLQERYNELVATVPEVIRERKRRL